MSTHPVLQSFSHESCPDLGSSVCSHCPSCKAVDAANAADAAEARAATAVDTRRADKAAFNADLAAARSEATAAVTAAAASAEQRGDAEARATSLRAVGPVIHSLPRHLTDCHLTLFGPSSHDLNCIV
jgi:hypothetical protein